MKNALRIFTLLSLFSGQAFAVTCTLEILNRSTGQKTYVDFKQIRASNFETKLVAETPEGLSASYLSVSWEGKEYLVIKDEDVFMKTVVEFNTTRFIRLDYMKSTNEITASCRH